MNPKVGDKVRIKTIEEMLAKHSNDFFGHDFFERYGNNIFIVTEVADGFLEKRLKVNVNGNWGTYYISSSAVDKISSKIDLPNELFEL